MLFFLFFFLHNVTHPVYIIIFLISKVENLDNLLEKNSALYCKKLTQYWCLLYYYILGPLKLPPMCVFSRSAVCWVNRTCDKILKKVKYYLEKLSNQMMVFLSVSQTALFMLTNRVYRFFLRIKIEFLPRFVKTIYAKFIHFYKKTSHKQKVHFSCFLFTLTWLHIHITLSDIIGGPTSPGGAGAMGPPFLPRKILLCWEAH